MILGTMCRLQPSPGFGPVADNLAIWIISQRMIPPIVHRISGFPAVRQARLVDTFTGLILLYTAFNLPYVIWMMRGYMEDVPLELEESALVDGLSRGGRPCVKVVLPMARTGLFATAVFTFIFAWNEFIFALVLTRNRGRHLPGPGDPLFRPAIRPSGRRSAR